MTESQIKDFLDTRRELKKLVGDDWRDVVRAMIELEEDFTVQNYRFISSDVIDDILAEELESDPYVLGCFNADFIARVTDWPEALIKAGQQAEGYQQIGEALIDGEFVEELAKAYAEADGYGHHFGHWNGDEEYIGECGYHAFRV